MTRKDHGDRHRSTPRPISGLARIQGASHATVRGLPYRACDAQATSCPPSSWRPQFWQFLAAREPCHPSIGSQMSADRLVRVTPVFVQRTLPSDGTVPVSIHRLDDRDTEHTRSEFPEIR